MTKFCNLCHLLQIQLNGDLTIDDEIKADARRQLFQGDGSDLTVDGFMGKESSKEKTECNKERVFGGIHRPFLNYCKKLFRNHRDNRVNCGICAKKLTMRWTNRKRKYLTLSSTIDHACFHLGKKIFACAHCDNTFTCRGTTFSHLSKKHKLNTHPSNYIDSSASNEQEILEILKRCYVKTGETVIPAAITRKRTSRQENHDRCPLSNFCRSLLKPDKDGRVPCSICGRVLVLHGRYYNGSRNFIGHAYVHLGKPLFKCGQCHLHFFTKHAIQRHLNKVHVIAFRKENYTDMSSNYQKEMMDILERCYGQQNLVKSESPDQPKRKPRSQVQLFKDPVSNTCRSLFAGFPADARVRCSLCGTEKKLYHYSSTLTIATIRFISHAMVHLAKSMFKCRLCDHSTVTRPAMLHHLLTFHKTTSSSVNYVDDSAKYQKEITAMFMKCFGQANMDVQVSGATKRKKGAVPAIRILSHTGTNTLLAERNTRCYELTRKFQESGKIKCRVCRLEMIPTTGIQHITNHLNRVIYHCRLCTHSSTSRSVIREHVKLIHGQPSKNQYDDRSNDFHAELLQLISDCFDWDQESVNGPEKEDLAVKSTSRILGGSRGNDLKAARLMYCHQLAQKFAQDGRITCRECSASIVVVNGKRKICSDHFLKHAMSHLKKVHRFECKQCLETAYDRRTIIKHLKNVHGSTDKTDCVDLSDIFHLKIMKVLTRCFDWSQE